MNDILSYFTKQIDLNSLTKTSTIKAKSFLDPFSFNHAPNKNKTYLVIGKNLISVGLKSLGYHVTEVDGINKNDLTIEGLIVNGTKFDYVIASDEYLTYYTSEVAQINAIEQLVKVTNIAFYTTLKDYKNMAPNQRFFYENFEVKTNSGDAVIVRKRDWNKSDKQRWLYRQWVIQNNKLFVADTVECRSMYFKQLAKFSSDAGAKDFQVEKKIMYKPLFSKSYEYIICISV